MKRYIRAMGMERKYAQHYIESYSDVIKDHLIEIVVYKDSLNCYNHWVNELAGWFADINNTDLKIKRNPPKFKVYEYEQMIFGIFGGSTSDCKGALMSYKANNKDYPDFEIDRTMILELSGAVRDIIDEFCFLWANSKKNSISNEEMADRIKDILDPYVLY